jgi:hypothetical protein
MLALLTFEDRTLAERGLALLLDPSLDGRETWNTLWYAARLMPTRRADNDFLMANFDALAKTVSPYAPGGWPALASGLCTSRDRIEVEAFWQPRLSKYEGADRALAMALESIDECVRLRPAS